MTKSKQSTQTPSNRVLAVDPGFDRLGIAVMEKVPGGVEQIIHSECVVTERKTEGALRLRTLGEAVRKVIEEHKPKALALEKLFFNQNVSTALRVAEARGVVLYEAARAGLTIHEYSPQAIKLAVTGYGKAAKVDVERMVLRLLSIKTAPKYDDETDAIAVGITHLATEKTIWYK